MVQTLKEMRATCRKLQEERDAARRRVESLEGEVTRYRHERDARTDALAVSEATIEREKDRAAEAERSLRHTVNELSRVRQEAAAARARADQLEAEVARRPQPVAIGQGIGVCESILDANQTLTQWCGVLTSERDFVGLLCYTFDLDIVVNALCRRQAPQVPSLCHRRRRQDRRAA